MRCGLPRARPARPPSLRRSNGRHRDESVVAENTGPGGNVGAPVTATGPTGITYSLEGPTRSTSTLTALTGQITVGGDIAPEMASPRAGHRPGVGLDDPAKRQTFSVTVKADGHGRTNQTAQVDGDHQVTDVNEPPEVKKALDSDGRDPVEPRQ